MGPGSEVGLLQSNEKPVEWPTVMDEAQRSAGPDSFWEGAGVVSSPDKVISGAPPAPPPSPKPVGEVTDKLYAAEYFTSQKPIIHASEQP